MKKHDVSIIIPTYNERENIAILLPRIFGVFEKSGIKGEVLIVDDNSPDGTAGMAESMKEGRDIKVIRRPGKMGLSSAVVDGMREADGAIIGIMDADLSHPPEEIPRMIKPIIEKKADITVASRYAEGGGVENWSFKRRIISRGAGILAKPITGLKDPLSGFFFFRRSVLNGKKLNPTGYKIALEVIVKSGAKMIIEVPYLFSDRRFGKSKLDLKEYFAYLRHLIKLYWYKVSR